MAEFTAASGAKVQVSPAPFQDAMALKNAVQREISSADFSLPLDPKKGTDQEIDIGELIKLIMHADSSEAVNEQIFKCLSRCKYNGEKIGEHTFEDPETWQDYYDIVFACLQENVAPFFKGLISRLGPYMDMLPADQAESASRT